MLPAQNLYRMLCYAWKHLPDSESVRALGAAEFEPIADLMGKMLSTALADLLRRGLDRAYVVEEEQTSSPRGRIDVQATLAKMLEQRGLVQCRRDELSSDVPHNRLLKATALRLANAVHSPETAASLVRLTERMVDVSDVEPSLEALRRIQLHRNVNHYVYPLAICELVLQQVVPEPAGSGWSFNDFTASSQEMGWLFEDFVRGFLEMETADVRVLRKERLRWILNATDDSATALIPSMELDVPLEIEGRRVLIETKYVREPLRTGRDGQPKLREEHLYQLHAYLTNSANIPEKSHEAGVLLYGTEGRSFSYEYSLGNVPLYVVGLDITRPWQEVHDELVLLPKKVLPERSGSEEGDIPSTRLSTSEAVPGAGRAA